jgi:hypothetical protein
MAKNLTLPAYSDNPFQIRLSFHKIIEQHRASPTENSGHLLFEVAKYPELSEGITDIEQIKNNEGLIKDLTLALFPPLLSQNEIKAISIPYQGLIFNYSDRFRHILQDAGEDYEIAIRNFDDQQFYIFSCCLILNRFYGIVVDFVSPLFCDIPTSAGYTRHYRILYNADFLEILPLKEVPPLSAAEITQLLNSYDDIDLWKQKFPREAWVLKGFSIMTLVDVTTENAVSELKSELLGSAEEPDLHLKLESVFRSLFRIKAVRIGFSSYDEVQGKFRNISFGQKIESFLLSEGNKEDLARTLFRDASEKLIKHQTYYTIADTEEFIRTYPKSNISGRFRSFQIGSFILAPIIKHGAVLGFLELASPNRNDFNSVNANRLDNVMQFLTDTVERKIAEFKNRVQAVIQSNYTTLHPSVNWKFEREVYNLFRNTESGQEYHLKEIRFRMVYPLYGQLDIQNSSITRNSGVQRDLLIQLEHLQQIFLELARDLADERLSAIKKWIDQSLTELTDSLKSNAEQQIQKFLETEVHPLWTGDMTESQTGSISKYLSGTDRKTGIYFQNRRDYERTLKLINSRLVSILDQRHTEVQKFFPHYYERFKTDGVEHNLYIGSSIYSGNTFTRTNLERVRIWQLLVTAEMETDQRRNKNKLPYPLGLTALILVYSSPISIRFRMDEKHFDLDAAYDIQYEIVKKRVDKAYIKGTSKRITAAEKLTIVYAKEEEREDYLKYLEILTDLDVLKGEIEEFDIEELQGVSGLKGLQIRIDIAKEASSFTALYQQAYQMLAPDPLIL